jgi:hypothetical protein
MRPASRDEVVQFCADAFAAEFGGICCLCKRVAKAKRLSKVSNEQVFEANVQPSIIAIQKYVNKMSTEVINPILPEFIDKLDPQFVDIYNRYQGKARLISNHNDEHQPSHQSQHRTSERTK